MDKLSIDVTVMDLPQLREVIEDMRRCLAQARHPRQPTHELWATIIQWFELEHGYNPDPSHVSNGEILRWALQQRAKFNA